MSAPRQPFRFGSKARPARKERERKKVTLPTSPMVHCVMPTTVKRRWCIERAIRCWLAQDYPEDRRRLVIIDGPNDFNTVEAVRDQRATEVRDLVPKHPRIHYIALKPGEPGTPADKYNLGASFADDGDLIALWADDDWHHPQRISFVVDAMRKAEVEIGGTVAMFAYRIPDKQLFLFTHPYVFTPGDDAAGRANASEEALYTLTLPYLIGGTMIFSKRAWARVEGFKVMKSGTDSEFINRLVLGRERWDLDTIRIAPQYGPNCSVTNVLVYQYNRLVFETALVQLSEPRLYCAFAHTDNTGNPVATGRQGSDTFQVAGDVELGVLRRAMGSMADEFLGPA